MKHPPLVFILTVVLVLVVATIYVNSSASATMPLQPVAESLARFQILENKILSMDGKLMEVMARLDAMAPLSDPDAPHKTDDTMTWDQAKSVSERICQKGICVMGNGTAPQWNLPPGKYDGAQGGRFEGDAKYQPGKKLAKRRTCASPSDTMEVSALPEWLAVASQASPMYKEIEGRLAALDICVEKTRKTYFSKEVPCFRCHSVAGSDRLVQVHSEMVRRLPRCRTICETGFNRGDSALILTTACGKDARAISFTLDSRWYTVPGRKCLAEGVLDEQRSITFVEGFSSTSINDFFGRNIGQDVKCDVVHVDGGKSEDLRMQDLLDLRRVSHPGTLWMSDDIYASCDKEVCRGVRDRKHCLFGVFADFLHGMNITMKCWTAKSSKSPQEAQCYGIANWSVLLHQ